jgi:hypothetical protein
VTGTRSSHSEPADIDWVKTTYRRMAAMDPPALRSLARELKRISDESFGSAGLQTGPAARARARRDAERAAAARSALGSLETKG